MEPLFTCRSRRAIFKGSAARLSMATALFALGGHAAVASAQQSRTDQAAEEEIIVTGTLLRGQAPVGSSVISAGQEKIQSSGATTSNELLSTIPQVSNLFNQAPSRRLGIAANQIQIARPNLRNISADNASSASTLVLFDGHRVASAGVTQASIDADLLPTAAIERVEVVTDGGSSTYGADAVGGVINFITRKRFDGLKLDVRRSFADDFWNLDASAIAGKDWGTGSAWVAYSFQRNRQLFNIDRDFIQNIDYVTGLPIGTTCTTPNFTIGGQAFTRNGSAFAPGTTLCDSAKGASAIPQTERHGVIAGLTQRLSDTVNIDLRGFWSKRTTYSSGEQVALGTPITSSNFYYQPLTPGSTATQTASFSLSPALGYATPTSGSNISEYGFNSEITIDLTSNLQSRTLLNYSNSDSRSYTVGPNTALLQAAGSGTTAATAINPYNVAATNPAVLANIMNNETFAGQARDELYNARQIVEGKLFKLPGGDLRVALGYEYQFDSFQQRTSQNRAIGALASIPYGKYSRTVHAVFGEIQLPIFGEDNARPGFQSLVVSAQGRYDHYSDFGGTFNPKIGATYKPVSWISVRGNWSRSFNAPTPLDQLQSQNNAISRFPFVAFPRPGDTIPAGAITVALQGSQPNLKPQKAETWSVGFDINPPFLEGLRASLSYYNVNFRDQLRTPSPNVTIFSNFPGNVQTNVGGISAADLRRFAQLSPNGASVIEPLIASGTNVYELVDFRTGNFGILKLDGLDWQTSYRHNTGFGAIDLGFNGNYVLSRKSQVSPTSPSIDELAVGQQSRLSMQTIVGADIGHFRAQATWNYTGGFPLQRSNNLPQDRLDSFSTVNLFFKYDVAGEGILKDLTFTVNANNLLDQDPPIYRGRGSGGFLNGNGFTVGREIILGVSKRF